LQILIQLRKAELLPEEIRYAAVKKIVSLCEREHSCRFADSQIAKAMFNNDEERTAIAIIATNLLSDGEHIIDDIRYDWDKESAPEDLFYEIDRSLAFIESDESFDEESQSSASYLRQIIREVVRELEQTVAQSTYEELETEHAIETSAPAGRSVFDDVDM
jgi:DNA anti-recombination protein RmuC